MNFIQWADGGEPPKGLPPGEYKVSFEIVATETGHLITIIRYLGPA